VSSGTATTNGTAAYTAAEWVQGFADGWRAPTDADSFSDHFDPMLSDEVRLIQPQLPAVTGKTAFREEFARPLFDLLHDVRGTVGSWASTVENDAEIIFIELEIRGRLAGGRQVTLKTTDAQALRDGVAVEDLPATVARTVVDSLRLGSATVEVAGTTVTAGHPHPDGADRHPRPGEAYAAELRHRGRTVGRLVVTPRPGEHALDARDREILTAIADHVAPATSSVATYAELGAASVWRSSMPAGWCR